jgi:hypothetical protein
MENELAGLVIAGAGSKRRCPNRKPVMIIAGRQDAAFAEAQSAAEYYRTRNGCMASTTPVVSPCASYTACAPDAPTTFCPWDGIHMWPLGFGGKAVVDFLGRLQGGAAGFHH